MRGLFRAFEREGADCLLIGGQAAILYGASHFTQDLDLWVRPDPVNLQAVLRSLARVGARVHKLTPPFSPRWVRRGHGFHFVIPQEGRLAAYVDVMGCPPRVGAFGPALRRCRRMKTPWGALAVVSVEDLVELKKTNRAGDYEVISRLVRVRLGETGAPSPARLAWAVRNTFRLEDLTAIFSAFGTRVPRGPLSRERVIGALLDAVRAGRAPTERLLASAGRALDARMGKHLEAGRKYWLPKIRDLRELRASGRLLPEGIPVRKLLESP